MQESLSEQSVILYDEDGKSLSFDRSGGDNLSELTLSHGQINGKTLLPEVGAELTKSDYGQLGLSKAFISKLDRWRRTLPEKFNVSSFNLVFFYEKDCSSLNSGSRDHLSVCFGEVVRDENMYVVEPMTLQHKLADDFAKSLGGALGSKKPLINVYCPRYDYRQGQYYQRNAVEQRKAREKLSAHRASKPLSLKVQQYMGITQNNVPNDLT